MREGAGPVLGWSTATVGRGGSWYRLSPRGSCTWRLNKVSGRPAATIIGGGVLGHVVSSKGATYASGGIYESRRGCVGESPRDPYEHDEPCEPLKRV